MRQLNQVDGATRAMPQLRDRRVAPPTSNFAALLDAARTPAAGSRGGAPAGPGRSPGGASGRAGGSERRGGAGVEPPSPPARLTGLAAASRREPTRSELLRQDLAAAAGITPVDQSDAGQWADLINTTAGKHGVDPTLVAAIARAESGFNPKAVSKAGAKGMMQLMDGTARGLGVADSFDPVQNVEGGTRYIGEMLKRFGTPELALAAYNAGPGAVAKHGGVPPYKETQTYVRRVLDYQQKMKAPSA